MLGKYDFSLEEGEKVGLFFNPAIAAIEAAFESFVDAVESINIDSNELTKMLNKLENLEYIDEFREIIDEWEEYKEIFNLKVVTLQLRENKTRPYFLYSSFYEVDCLIRMLNKFVCDSYDLIKAKKDVLDLEEIKVMLSNRIEDVLSRSYTILNNSVNTYVKKMGEKLKEILDSNYEKEEYEEVLFEYQLFFTKLNEKETISEETFWLDNGIKTVYSYISSALALMTFLNFLNEYEYEED